MSIAVDVSGLWKKYGDVVAVRDLSFAVGTGVFFGLLGPNGAGKSTTIGCLTGTLQPSRGRVTIFGQSLDPEAIVLKRRLGVVPDNLGVFEYLYAHEFLEFQAEMYGLARAIARRRAEELLDALGLRAQGRQPLGTFSSGMRKRVAFAAAVIHRPEILFLDEPFESVDPAGVALMKQWLRRFTAQGGTILLTTHVLDVAERLCDRVLIVQRPAEKVWEGDLRPLARDGHLTADGMEFRTLEELFLFKTGRTAPSLDWL